MTHTRVTNVARRLHMSIGYRKAPVRDIDERRVAANARQLLQRSSESVHGRAPSSAGAPPGIPCAAPPLTLRPPRAAQVRRHIERISCLEARTERDVHLDEMPHAWDGCISYITVYPAPASTKSRPRAIVAWPRARHQHT